MEALVSSARRLALAHVSLSNLRSSEAQACTQSVKQRARERGRGVVNFTLEDGIRMRRDRSSPSRPPSRAPSRLSWARGDGAPARVDRSASESPGAASS
eukprot:6027148-Pleurochrysis_carterae.AAC.3